jgi:hypothetical protein
MQELPEKPSDEKLEPSDSTPEPKSLRKNRHVSFEDEPELPDEEEDNEEKADIPKRGPRKLFKQKRRQAKPKPTTTVKEDVAPALARPLKRKRKLQIRGPVPRFFRDPEHASEEERRDDMRHLYGPFYVVWPKTKDMPSSYAELARIYGRRY